MINLKAVSKVLILVSTVTLQCVYCNSAVCLSFCMKTYKWEYYNSFGSWQMSNSMHKHGSLYYYFNGNSLKLKQFAFNREPRPFVVVVTRHWEALMDMLILKVLVVLMFWISRYIFMPFPMLYRCLWWLYAFLIQPKSWWNSKYCAWHMYIKT